MHIPFLLHPAHKDYLWGGTHLKQEFAKESTGSSLAETWECSTHPDGPSIVANGPYQGKTLREVLRMRPDFIGTHPHTKDGQIPVLVKLIDAQQNLSVQVHPTDEYASTHAPGQLGKTEMWYILQAKPGAKLIYGFKRPITPALLRQSIADGSLPRYLQEISVYPQKVFYIAPGTVHAIGAGIVLAEVQENSNITYRLYDYNRRDKNGKLRPLHIDQAIQVASLQASAEPASPMRVLHYQPGFARELLARCKYFLVHRILLNRPADNTLAYQTDANSFHIFLCVHGQGCICWPQHSLNFKKGDCVFIPANSVPLTLCGNTQILQVSC